MGAYAKDTANVEEYESIFESYLDVCNEAIEKNKDQFPYAEIWKARWKDRKAGQILRCAVYDDKPKVIYTLQLTEDMKIKIIEKSHEGSEDVWPFKYTYLKNVVNNSQEYVTHPSKLDWGWLTDVFG
jgi:hypothetical protein